MEQFCEIFGNYKIGSILNIIEKEIAFLVIIEWDSNVNFNASLTGCLVNV